jgi:ATP/maltotriose-dependent transcriptional regulator MalT/DNA-binding SARP family transcriptional activator
VIEALKRARSYRLTALVAGPGYGKTVALSTLANEVPTAWYTAGSEDAALPTLAGGIVGALRVVLPALLADVRAVADGAWTPGPDESGSAEAFAALLCESLSDQLTDDVILVVDDVQEIARGTGAARLLQGLCRHAPQRFHVVLASRKDLPFSIQRLRGRGQVLDIDASVLAFTAAEVADVLTRLGFDQAGLVSRFREVTGGWPAAVRLAAETMRTDEPTEILKELALHEGRLHSYLAEEVVSAEPPQVQDFLRVVSRLERFSAELCAAAGLRDAPAILGDLARRGLVVGMESASGMWFRMPTLMREFVLDRFPLDGQKTKALHRKAAAWFKTKGDLADVLRSLALAGDDKALRDFLAKEGGVLFESGYVRELIEAARSIPGSHRTPDIDLWVGQAKQAQGDFEGALACYKRAGGDADQLSPGLAWRIGQIHYLRGEPDLAMDAYSRGRINGGDSADESLLLAWTAALHWMQGDAEACRKLAEPAHQAALESGDDRALAAAHTILAMLAAIDGDRRANDAHYLQGLEAADRAGDLFQVVRIRTNRASHLYEEGWFERAVIELDIAIRLAELAGFTSLLPLALSNRGWTSYYRGRLEDAAGDFERSRLLYQRLDSRKIAYPLQGLGTIYLQRGDLALARSSFEEAVRQADAARDVQGLVPSLAGLALVLASDEPERAAELSARAIASGTGMGYVQALLAGGWVAFSSGNRERALQLGETAASTARERRDRIGLAEALQLIASSLPASDRESEHLEEAKRLWHELGNPIGEAQADLALAAIGPAKERGERLETAWRTLESLGIRRGSTAAGPLSAFPRVLQPPLAIRSLGSFQLLRDGSVVPITEWQSKKSRELLKILVARRGDPIHRERLADMLWPDGDPGQMASRLSVALSRIRAALDPEHRFPPDHYIAAGEDAIALSIEQIDIDVDRFMRVAQQGLALLREGRTAEALPFLQTGESTYSGEFLEEDAYEEWAVPLREQARALYIGVTRGLADAAAKTGDPDTAVRCYLRALERDPYDEEAHLGLISTAASAGHHGEARRYYRAYVAKMDEIGVEAAPFPTADRV